MRLSNKPFFWFLVALLFRLPFLFQGYGVEEDAWGHVLNVFEMQEQGRYILSRLPGHPLLEGWLYLLGKIAITPFLFNLGAALASGWAVVSFFHLYNHYHLPHRGWALLAFMLVPVFWVNSVTTMDYTYALAFGLAAWLQVAKGRTWVAGILLGLGIGFRITTALWGAPFWLILFYTEGRWWSKKHLQLVLSSALVGIACYVVPLLTYGLDFLSTYDLPYPNLPKVLYKGSIGVWGPLGTLAILIGLASWHRKAAASFIWPVLLHLGLTALLYFNLPEKSAFWLPAVPFVIMLVGAVGRGKLWRRLLQLMVLSPFMMGINLQDGRRGSLVSNSAHIENIGGQAIAFDPWVGPLVADLSKRWNKDGFVEDQMECLQDEQEPQVILAGYWYAMLEVARRERELPDEVKLLYYCPPKVLDSLQNADVPLYYLGEQGQVNNSIYQNTQATTYGKPYTCK